MTEKKVPHEKKRIKERRPPLPMTIGDILGEAIEKDRAEKARRAELDSMGFRPLKGA